MARLGLISDTHGLLRPEAMAALAGCERIVHAGDIGGPDILEALSALAPVTAVRGNNDRADWAAGLPETAWVEWAGWRLLVLHDLKQLAIDPVRAGAHAVVAGHSHKPVADRRDGVWFINPGSAGPRRFRLPVTVAELEQAPGGIEPRIVPLL